MLAPSHINRLIAHREVELVLRGGSAGDELILQGEYEGYGDFFTITLNDVEYIEAATRIVLGGIYVEQLEEIVRKRGEWSRLSRDFSGLAIAYWSQEWATLESAPAGRCCLAVANQIRISKGTDWPL